MSAATSLLRGYAIACSRAATGNALIPHDPLEARGRTLGVHAGEAGGGQQTREKLFREGGFSLKNVLQAGQREDLFSLFSFSYVFGNMFRAPFTQERRKCTSRPGH